MPPVAIRPKNQVTLPGPLLAASGLRQGDLVEFAPLPAGGLAIYPIGHRARRRTALDVSRAIASSIPGLDAISFDPERDPEVLRPTDLS